MSDSGPDERLEREGRVLGRYLAGGKIPDHLVARYTDHVSVTEPPGQDPLDRTLLRVACHGGPITPMADAYARWFRPTGALRRRLTILCALLESSPPYHIALGAPREGSRWRSATALVIIGLMGGLTLAGAVLLFGPVHVGLLARGKGRKR